MPPRHNTPLESPVDKRYRVIAMVEKEGGEKEGGEKEGSERRVVMKSVVRMRE